MCERACLGLQALGCCGDCRGSSECVCCNCASASTYAHAYAGRATLRAPVEAAGCTAAAAKLSISRSHARSGMAAAGLGSVMAGQHSLLRRPQETPQRRSTSPPPAAAHRLASGASLSPSPSPSHPPPRAVRPDCRRHRRRSRSQASSHGPRPRPLRFGFDRAGRAHAAACPRPPSTTTHNPPWHGNLPRP